MIKIEYLLYSNCYYISGENDYLKSEFFFSLNKNKTII